MGHQTLLMYKILDLYCTSYSFEILGFKLKNKNNNVNEKKN